MAQRLVTTATHQLTVALPAGAAQVVINTQAATVNTAQTTLNGNLQVNGEVKSTGDMVAGSVSLQQHVHAGVQGGPSNTGKPQ